MMIILQRKDILTTTEWLVKTCKKISKNFFNKKRIKYGVRIDSIFTGESSVLDVQVMVS